MHGKYLEQYLACNKSAIMLIIIITSCYKGATLSRDMHHRLPTREVKEGQDPRTLRSWVWTTTSCARQYLWKGYQSNLRHPEETEVDLAVSVLQMLRIPTLRFRKACLSVTW